MVNSGSSECEAFINTCADFNLTQLDKEPTHTTSSSATILDLLLTSHPSMVVSVSLLPGVSDHAAIQFDLWNTSPNGPKAVKSIRDYARGNFSSINTELEIFLHDFVTCFPDRSVHENWLLYKSKVFELTNRYIPLRRIKVHNCAPWFTPSLNRLRNKNQRLLRKARLSPAPTRWTAYHATEIRMLCHMPSLAFFKQRFRLC